MNAETEVDSDLRQQFARLQKQYEGVLGDIQLDALAFPDAMVEAWDPEKRWATLWSVMERELPQAVITAEALADSQCARTRSNADLVRVEWEKIVWTARAEIPAQAAPAASIPTTLLIHRRHRRRQAALKTFSSLRTMSPHPTSSLPGLTQEGLQTSITIRKMAWASVTKRTIHWIPVTASLSTLILLRCLTGSTTWC